LGFGTAWIRFWCDENGRVNKNGGKFEGLDRYEARKSHFGGPKKLSLLDGIEDLKHIVGPATAAGTPWSYHFAQWLVKMERYLRKHPRGEDGEIKFVPDRFS
jgi:valyl-tRNA synthetase